MNYISVINVNAISLISCSFKSPKSFISTFRLALRALARSSCFWLASANLANNFKTTSIVHRAAGFEILLSQLLLHEQFVWLGAQVKHNRGTWWAVSLPQGGGNEVDLLAPWQSVPAVRLLCEGAASPCPPFNSIADGFFEKSCSENSCEACPWASSGVTV